MKTRHGRTIAIVAVTAILLLAAWAASQVLLLTFGAVLFASLLGGAADWLCSKTPLGRGPALATVLLLILLATGGGVWLLASTISAQAKQLSTTLPAAFQEATAKLDATDWGGRVLDEIRDWEKQPHAGMLGQVGGVFSTTVGVIGAVALLAFLSIYFAAQPHVYRSGLLRLFGKGQRERLGEVFDEIGSTLQRWFIGQLLDMTFVAVATAVALSLLGMPLAITLGLIGGVADFIPNLGPLLAAVPALLIAFTISPMHVLWVGLIYLAVQVCENQVLAPLVQRRAVDLPPAVTILSQATLGVLFGFPGLLFATPIAAAARIAIERLYVEDRLEREPHGVESSTSIA